MTVRRLAAVDAQTYWLSAKIPNDPLLLYGFAGVPDDLEQAIEVIRGRADDCAELRLRVRDGNTLTYPAWVSVDVDAGQFTVHELDDNSWAGCLAAVGRLADDQLDPRVRPWRLHVFTPWTAYPAPRDRDGGRPADLACPSPTVSGHRRWRRGCSAGRSTSRR